jgi:indole-3-glycerol phosphate synthase
VIVGESGITRRPIWLSRGGRHRAFLVGESLMRQATWRPRHALARERVPAAAMR